LDVFINSYHHFHDAIPAVTAKVAESRLGWTMPNELLIAEFDREMFRIYQRALAEAKYNASRFLQMLYAHRGLETAMILLHSPTVSEGYTALWERGRLDLTVEALIHDHVKWHPLFSENDLAICTKRLEEYQYLKS
jgi:hypothetical protein